MNSFTKLTTKRFSERNSCDFTIQQSTFTVITKATRDFLFENFRGAVSISEDVTHSVYTKVAPEGLALYFKVILRELFGSCLLFVHIKSETKTLKMNLHFSKDNYDLKSEDELNYIAKNSGFESEYKKEENKHILTLTFREERFRTISIHAITSLEIKHAFNKIFFL